MSRRIEVELTSTRDDGTWTWRAAGARQPKGEVDGGLLYEGAKVGDVVRADADFDIEGITVTAVLAPKSARTEPERLEIIGPPRRDDDLVTTTLAPKSKGRDRGPRRDKDRPRRSDGAPSTDRPRQDARSGKGRDRDDTRRGRPGEEGTPGRDSGRPPRAKQPPADAKPKPKRLRAGRVHRKAVLAEIPEEHQAIAEQVLRGGIPGIRQAVAKQNEENKAAGQPEIAADPLVDIGEKLLPRLRTAEWHDKADAALADLDELDLRDLRSVVVAADQAARDDETRALADQLRQGLTQRVEREQAAWLAEISATLADGRVVRALRLSSRPPKAGAPLPPDLAQRLTEAASGALTAETGPDRFATVLDALAYSPVRQTVTAQGLPASPGEPLIAAVTKLASRLPQIATQFGITPPAPSARGRGPRSGLRPRFASGDADTNRPRPVPPPPPVTPDTAATPLPRETPAGAPEPEASPSAITAAEAPSGELAAAPAPAGELEGPEPVAGELAVGEAPAPIERSSVADPVTDAPDDSRGADLHEPSVEA